MSQTLIHDNTLFDVEKNTLILNATIEDILSTERFEEAAFVKYFQKISEMFCYIYSMVFYICMA